MNANAHCRHGQTAGGPSIIFFDVRLKLGLVIKVENFKAEIIFQHFLGGGIKAELPIGH